MSSIKRIATLVSLALVAVTLSACSVFEANDLAPTITDIVVETEAVSTLKDAVVQQGLDDDLDERSVKYTVFAPTNEAFAQFLAETNLTADQLLALPGLTDILLYHVVDTELPSSAVIGSAPGTVTTLQGDDLDYAVVDGGVVLTDANGRDVNVVTTDITAFNGVIHLIDNVLLPTGAATITDIVVATEGVSILRDAVVQQGLDGALDDPSAAYTVFAPTDAAFAAFLTETGFTAAELLALPGLTDVLLYHVVDAELPASAVIGSAPGTVTTLQGNDLDYAVVDGGVVLTDAAGRDVNVVATDITATNGVIHLIDNVLLPPTIAQLASATDLTETLVAALGAAGLVETFDDVTASFTVFAPTEQAFAAYLADTGLSEAALLASPNLGDILRYHVIDGAELFAADVIAAAPTTVTTLQGGDIDVAVVDGGVVLTDETGRDINVVATDINALNGVIHLIDYVLVPEIAPAPVGF